MDLHVAKRSVTAPSGSFLFNPIHRLLGDGITLQQNFVRRFKMDSLPPSSARARSHTWSIRSRATSAQDSLTLDQSSIGPESPKRSTH